MDKVGRSRPLLRRPTGTKPEEERCSLQQPAGQQSLCIFLCPGWDCLFWNFRGPAGKPSTDNLAARLWLRLCAAIDPPLQERAPVADVSGGLLVRIASTTSQPIFFVGLPAYRRSPIFLWLSLSPGTRQHDINERKRGICHAGGWSRLDLPCLKF